MVNTKYKRGDIVWIDFGEGVGSEQGGARPALIVQNDTGNRYSPTLQVAPITTAKKKSFIPTHMEIGTETGLKMNSIVLFEQIRVVDKQRICGCIGHKAMGREEDIMIATTFGCDSFSSALQQRSV